MIRDTYEKYIMILDEESFGEKEGIKHVLVW